MRSLGFVVALAFGIVEGGLPAQQVLFGLHPATATFASRGSLGSGAGEICMGFGPAIVRGLGETQGGAKVVGMRTVVQDFNANTPENLQLVLRAGNEASGPGSTPGDVLFASATITTPGGGSGVATWLMTVTFASAVTVPTDGYFSASVAVTAIGGGFDSLYLQAAIGGAGGEHPNAPDISWQIFAASGLVSHLTNKQLPHISVMLPSNSFRISNILGAGIPPLFGLGGSYPDTTAGGPMSQGLAFAVTHTLGAAANALVFASLSLAPSPSLLPGFRNRLQLDGSSLILATFPSGVADGSTLPFLSAGVGALPNGLNASIVFQALVVDPGSATLEFTNAEILHLL